jgi:RNA polymerase sigma-70 factor (ECF subfamily)
MSQRTRPLATDDTAEAFLVDAERRLRRAFIAAYGTQRAADATAEALAWAWEHRGRLADMENPVGYLYRVGQSRTRLRSTPSVLPEPAAVGLPDIEPALVPALRALPDTQRTAVWLVHACGWSYAECAIAMDVSVSAVGTHVSRALAALRKTIGAGLSADAGTTGAKETNDA